MNMSLSRDNLYVYLEKQLNNFFPDNNLNLKSIVKKSLLDLALERLEYCLDSICVNGYHDEEGNSKFSHLHADQYATFIWFLSNTIWKNEANEEICNKLLQLNRIMHQIFISYKCGLPDHFFLGHPIGTILGNAIYGDYLVVMQNVTVNTPPKDFGNEPLIIGKGCFLGAYSKIVGNEPIGDYVSLGIDTLIYQKAIPNNAVVINSGNEYVIRERKNEYCRAQQYFKDRI